MKRLLVMANFISHCLGIRSVVNAYGSREFSECRRALSAQITLRRVKMKKNAWWLSMVVVALGLVVSGCAEKQQPGAGAGAADASEAKTLRTITVEHAKGTTEVPFAPKRVFVLDLASLDTIDALGLGEYVAGVQEFRNIPEYLSTYYDREAIVVLPTALQGHRDEDAVEAGYNAIDADLIIGGPRQFADYELLSEIAPTIIMVGAGVASGGGVPATNSGALLDLTKSEAAKMASIWGKDAEIEAILADYAARAAVLKQAVSGKSGIVAAPNTRIGGITLSTDAGTFLAELGFVNLSETAPEDLGGVQAMTAGSWDDDDDDEAAAGVETGRGGSGRNEPLDPEAVAEAVKIINGWIEAQNPEYVLIYDTLYTSLDEAAKANAEYTGVRDLTVYKNGRTFFLSGVSTTKGGLTFAESQIVELEAIFF
jgi:ABC-type enterochelin transport system substrate-binding protein